MKKISCSAKEYIKNVLKSLNKYTQRVRNRRAADSGLREIAKDKIFIKRMQEKLERS